MVSAPSPPDPYETAAAQGSSNREAAIASSLLNNPNEKTPFGTLKMQQTGTYTGLDAQGNPYEIPTYTRKVRLSDDEQQKLNQSNRAQLGLLSAANRQIGTIKNTLSKPIDLSGGPQRVNSVNAPKLDSSLDFNGPDRVNSIQAPTLNGNVGTPNLRETVNFGQLDRSYASGGRIADKYARGGDIQSSYAPEDGFSADRDRTQEALLSRINPELERGRAALETSLVNQGFTRGTEAFQQAMDQQGRQENDARYGALLNASQEQSRLLGEARAAGEFYNAAQAQRDDQGYRAGAFANAAQGQRDDQAYRRAEFGNNAMQQNGLNRMATAQFANDARQQGFQNDLTAQGFANDTAMTQFGAQAAAGAFQNDARAAALQEAMARGSYGNAVAQQGFQNNLNSAAFQNDARNNYVQEQFAQRNQPLNEFGAAISGGQVNAPQFQNMYRQGIDPSPVADSIYRSYEAERANSNAMMSGLFGLASAPFSMFSFSDERIKEDIRPVGETTGGTKLYSYRYKGDSETRIGPMAQEVAKRQPEAVAVHKPTGLLAVNYSTLH